MSCAINCSYLSAIVPLVPSPSLLEGAWNVFLKVLLEVPPSIERLQLEYLQVHL